MLHLKISVRPRASQFWRVFWKITAFYRTVSARTYWPKQYVNAFSWIKNVASLLCRPPYNPVSNKRMESFSTMWSLCKSWWICWNYVPRVYQSESGQEFLLLVSAVSRLDWFDEKSSQKDLKIMMLLKLTWQWRRTCLDLIWKKHINVQRKAIPSGHSSNPSSRPSTITMHTSQFCPSRMRFERLLSSVKCSMWSSFPS